MNPTELVKLYQEYKKNGGKLRDTTDAQILAGCYVEWAGGDLKRAIDTLKTHDGRYLDRPNFDGRVGALRLLQSVELGGAS